MLALTMLAVLVAPPLAAQRVGGDDFRWIRLEAGALAGLGGDLLGSWAPARGVFLRMSAPYGAGEAAARLELARQHALSGAPGDLDAARMVVGWALPLGFLGTRLGADLGIEYFRLPRAVNPGESEVTAGLNASAAVKLPARWRLTLGAGRRWTLTDPLLRRDVVTLGLGRAFPSPGALARALGGGPARAAGTSPQSPSSGGMNASPARERASSWPGALRDVPGWVVSSVDGTTVLVAPPGAASLQGSRLLVRVDGWPVPLELLGVLLPGRLPVEWTSVEAIATRSGFEAGVPSAGAVIDVVLRPLPPGFSLHLGGNGANATGDGGPRALVEGGGPNVESLAWGYGLSGGWRGEGLQVRVEGSHRRRWVSELPVFRRNFEAVDSDVRWPWIDLRRGRVAVSAAAGGFRHELSAGGSLVDDFFRLPALVREVPVRAGLGAVWLRGSRQRASGWTFEYGVGRTVNSLRSTANTLGRRLDWRETVSAARLGARDEHLAVELTAHDVRTRAARRMSDVHDGRVALRGEVAFPLPGTSLAGAAAASALRTDGRWGGSASLRLAAGAGWGARLGVESTPPAARGGLWLQEARGLGLLEAWGVTSALESGVPALLRASVEAWRRWSWGAGWLEARGRVDRISGALLPRLDVAVVDGVPRPQGPLAVATDGDGLLGRATISYGWARAELEGSGWYSLSAALQAEAPVKDAQAALPRHRSVHRVRWRPLPGLALGARVEARSSVRFHGYPAQGAFSGRIPAGAWLDLEAEKTLAAERVVLTLAVRDALDRELPTHPLAGTPGLTLHVGARLRLGAQPQD